jgi:hypothetical protein
MRIARVFDDLIGIDLVPVFLGRTFDIGRAVFLLHDE